LLPLTSLIALRVVLPCTHLLLISRGRRLEPQPPQPLVTLPRRHRTAPHDHRGGNTYDRTRTPTTTVKPSTQRSTTIARAAARRTEMSTAAIDDVAEELPHLLVRHSFDVLDGQIRRDMTDAYASYDDV
jgi:hypothetical protein